MTPEQLVNEQEQKITQPQRIFISYLMHLYAQVHNLGFSFLASFDGRHRSGKSITAITWASLLDASFFKNMERRLPTEPKEFIDIYENDIAKRNRRGAVVVVDEAGVSFASSDWYERWLKTVAKMVQMFGYLRPVVFFVAPVKDFVDARLRKMFHAYYKVRRYNNKETTITPYHLKYSTLHKKTLYKKPVIHFADQKLVIRSLIMGKPPSWLLERYAELEINRKNEMLKKFADELKKEEIKEKRKEISLEELIKQVVKDWQFFASKRSKPEHIILDPTSIQVAFKTTHRLAQYIKRRAEEELNKKGADNGD
jgi:hypothetical protein